MGRQATGELGLQLRGEIIAPCAIGHHEGHQLGAAGTFTYHHSGFAHAFTGLQHGFDFTQFDTETTNLHLGVHPAEEFQQPVRAPTRQIATAVTTAAIGERHKALGGQRRTTDVAAGDTGAGHIEFADLPNRYRLQVGAQ
ncbi:hypothetical protein D9M69_635010 [compost metagenome]